MYPVWNECDLANMYENSRLVRLLVKNFKNIYSVVVNRLYRSSSTVKHLYNMYCTCVINGVV